MNFAYIESLHRRKGAKGAARHLIDMVWLFPQCTHRPLSGKHSIGMEKSAQPGEVGGALPSPFTIFSITLSKTTANGASCFGQLRRTFLSLYFNVKIVDNYRDIGTHRDGIFKLLRSIGIDSKESIALSLVAWRTSATTLFLLGSWPLQIVLNSSKTKWQNHETSPPAIASLQ
jgi:hypothetical protein